MPPRTFRALVAALADLQTLTKQDIAERYQVTGRTIERWRAVGRLPAPFHCSARSPRWRLADLVAWETQQARKNPAR